MEYKDLLSLVEKIAKENGIEIEKKEQKQEKTGKEKHLEDYQNKQSQKCCNSEHIGMADAIKNLISDEEYNLLMGWFKIKEDLIQKEGGCISIKNEPTLINFYRRDKGGWLTYDDITVYKIK